MIAASSGNPALRGAGVLIAIACVVFGLAACDQPRSTPRPSASLLDVEFTPQPTRTVRASAAPTASATFVGIPVGWDDAFCDVFSDAVVAQELIIDIERAIEEENLRDARGLARDLRDTTADATELLTGLPAWEPATEAMAEIAALIDLGARAGAEYGTYFTEETRNALRRARALRNDLATRTPQANEALAGLASLGIACGALPLQLEQP